MFPTGHIATDYLGSTASDKNNKNERELKEFRECKNIVEMANLAQSKKLTLRAAVNFFGLTTALACQKN